MQTKQPYLEILVLSILLAGCGQDTTQTDTPLSEAAITDIAPASPPAPPADTQRPDSDSPQEETSEQ